MLTSAELAKQLNVHPETIRRMVRRGAIPFYKLSETEYRFDLNEVLDALRNGAKNDE